MNNLEDVVKKVLRIRNFEIELLNLFSKGFVSGTTHTCIGQEAIPSTVSKLIQEYDFMISNHRSHGHYLALTEDYAGLLKEILGMETGVCSGIGGSQHLASGQFLSNGILGSLVPVGLGISLSNKLKNNSGVVVIFLSDGAFGQGVLYESLNIASLLKLSILFVVENNQIAQSTSIINHLAGQIKSRFEAFDITFESTDDQDILKLFETFQNNLNNIRNDSKPRSIEVRTQRLKAHSKGDDTRSEKELEELSSQDPLKKISFIEKTKLAELETESAIFIRDIFSQVLTELKEDNRIKEFPKKPRMINTVNGSFNPVDDPTKFKGLKGSEYLNRMYLELFENFDQLVMLGEDLADPYGGAFKVSKGLSTAFPSRVISLPISEQAMVGIGCGLSISGYIAIVEIMFGDFITLIVDQLVNNAAKFEFMYDGKVMCPLVIRTPMGGYRGYGPTHSQSLEKLFFGFKDLHVIAYSNFVDQFKIWSSILKLNSPVVYVENKTLYSKSIKRSINSKIDDFYVRESGNTFGTLELQIMDFHVNSDVSIFVYGGLVEDSLSAAKEFYLETELVARVIVFSQISPLDEIEIVQSLQSSSKILIVEESFPESGWASHISFLAYGKLKFKGEISNIAAKGSVIPNSAELESLILPSKSEILKELRSLSGRT